MKALLEDKETTINRLEQIRKTITAAQAVTLHFMCDSSKLSESCPNPEKLLVEKFINNSGKRYFLHTLKKIVVIL